MSLQKLLEEYDRCKENASKDPGEYNYRSRPGIEVMVREAKNLLVTLEKQYAQEFADNAMGIFVDGDLEKTAELVQFFSSYGVVVDADKLYREIATQVEPTIGASREFTSHQAARMNNAINEVGLSLGVVIQPIEIGAVVLVKTLQDLVEHINKLVRAALGDNLNRLYLNREMVTQALEKRFSGNSAPVIVINARDAEIPGLSTTFGKKGGRFVVKDDAVIDTKYIATMVKETKNTIKQAK